MYIAQSLIETQDLRNNKKRLKYSLLTVYDYYENIRHVRNSHIFFFYENILWLSHGTPFFIILPRFLFTAYVILFWGAKQKRQGNWITMHCRNTHRKN